MLLKGGSNDTELQCICVCWAVSAVRSFTLRTADCGVELEEDNEEDVLFDRCHFAG